MARLAGGGIIHRFQQGRHVYFKADESCPIYDELRGIVAKTSGLTDVLRESLSTMVERIRVAFVYGSIARGDEDDLSPLS